MLTHCVALHSTGEEQGSPTGASSLDGPSRVGTHPSRAQGGSFPQDNCRWAAGPLLWALCQQTLAFNPVEAERRELQTGQVLHVNGSGVSGWKMLPALPVRVCPGLAWRVLAAERARVRRCAHVAREQTSE